MSDTASATTSGTASPAPAPEPHEQIHGLLDDAAAVYRKTFASLGNGRADQFEAALARVKMTVDHSADELPKWTREKAIEAARAEAERLEREGK